MIATRRSRPASPLWSASLYRRRVPFPSGPPAPRDRQNRPFRDGGNRGRYPSGAGAALPALRVPVVARRSSAAPRVTNLDVIPGGATGHTRAPRISEVAQSLGGDRLTGSLLFPDQSRLADRHAVGKVVARDAGQTAFDAVNRSRRRR